MISENHSPPIISVVGASGAGKTTLLERLIPELTRRGLRVGTIKHDVHGFELDRPGKDSWRHKRAGAAISVISSPRQMGMVRDVDHDPQPDELALFFTDVDLILTEGYKRGRAPKVEVFRREILPEPMCKDDPQLMALVSDEAVDVGVPRYSTEDIEGLADFLIAQF